MAPPSPNSDENKMWLRQKGNVKEFNSFFDEATSKLQLPECYLVMTYVAGLKKEMADSIRLFYPCTMQAARSMARAQEIFLQRQAEKARKASEDESQQQMTLFVKTQTREAHPETQETSVAQERDVQEEGENLESFVLEQETKSDEVKNEDSKTSCGSMQGLSSETERIEDATDVYPCGIVSNFGSLGETHQVSRVIGITFGVNGSAHEINQYVRTPKAWKSSNMTCVDSGSQLIKVRSKFPVKPKEPVLNLGSFPPNSSKAESVLLRDDVQNTVAVAGSSFFGFVGGLQVVSDRMDRCEAVNVSGFQLVPCRIIFSPTYPISSTVHPIAIIIPGWIGIQLFSIFSKSQKSWGKALSLALTDDCLSFVFQEKGPSSWLQWVISIKPVPMSIN